MSDLSADRERGKPGRGKQRRPDVPHAGDVEQHQAHGDDHDHRKRGARKDRDAGAAAARGGDVVRALGLEDQRIGQPLDQAERGPAEQQRHHQAGNRFPQVAERGRMARGDDQPERRQRPAGGARQRLDDDVVAPGFAGASDASQHAEQRAVQQQADGHAEQGR